MPIKQEDIDSLADITNEVVDHRSFRSQCESMVKYRKRLKKEQLCTAIVKARQAVDLPTALDSISVICNILEEII